MRKWSNKILANKITWLFESNGILTNSEANDLYNLTLKALNNNNKEDLIIMLDYFKYMKKTKDEDVRDVYFELVDILENIK